MASTLCPRCGATIQYAEEFLAGPLSCPACGERLQLGSESPPPPAPEETPPAEAPAVVPVAGPPPRKRAGFWGFLPAAVVLAAGVGVGAWMLTARTAPFEEARAATFRVHNAGTRAYDLDRPGVYTLFWEYEASPDRPAWLPFQRQAPANMGFEVRSADTGAACEVIRGEDLAREDAAPVGAGTRLGSPEGTGGGMHGKRPYYYTAGRIGDGLHQVVIPKAGRYLIFIDAPEGMVLTLGPEYEPAVRRLRGGALAGFLVLIGSVALALLLASLALWSRMQANRELRPVLAMRAKRAAARARRGW